MVVVVVVSRFTEEVAALNSGPGMARGESPAGGSSWYVNVRGGRQRSERLSGPVRWDMMARGGVGRREGHQPCRRQH